MTQALRDSAIALDKQDAELSSLRGEVGRLRERCESLASVDASYRRMQDDAAALQQQLRQAVCAPARRGAGACVRISPSASTGYQTRAKPRQ